MSAPESQLLAPQVVGRYALYGEIASGGMAVVQFARLIGEAGFQRTVAVKRLHPQYASDESFVQQFVNEARLASHIHHPNVVQTYDVVRDTNELLLVMEYVHGETLAHLLKAARHSTEWVPEPIGIAIISNALRGLHAAHEATDESGQALGIVHRDISPENIVVDTDGRSAVLDFGIAKAQGLIFSTDGQQLKGKFRYMSPEQVRGKKVDRRSDIFAMGITLFRVLTRRHVFGNQSDAATMLYRVLNMPIRKPSMIVPHISGALDAVVAKSLERDPNRRFATAEEFAVALEEAVQPARPKDVGLWVESVAGQTLKERAALLREISAHSQSGTFRVGRNVSSASQRTIEEPSRAPEPTSEDLNQHPWPKSNVPELISATEVAKSDLALAHVWPVRGVDVVAEYPAPGSRRHLMWGFVLGVILAGAMAAIIWQRTRPSSSLSSPAPAQVNSNAPKAEKHSRQQPIRDPRATESDGSPLIGLPQPSATLDAVPLPSAKPGLKPKAKARALSSTPAPDADPLSRRH
ncbi:MAG: serine/threonine-protein kinase [Polyangiaceae bacterium]|nr:serine/threonine-protein kinase [Polyangiaceae bacterium]